MSDRCFEEVGMSLGRRYDGGRELVRAVDSPHPEPGIGYRAQSIVPGLLRHHYSGPHTREHVCTAVDPNH